MEINKVEPVDTVTTTLARFTELLSKAESYHKLEIITRIAIKVPGVLNALLKEGVLVTIENKDVDFKDLKFDANFDGFKSIQTSKQEEQPGDATPIGGTSGEEEGEEEGEVRPLKPTSRF